MPRERTIERAFVKKCKELEALCIKFTPEGLTGFPDRIILAEPKIIFFVEFKASEKDNVTALQQWVHNLLTKLGFDVYVVWSKEQFNAIFKEQGLQSKVVSG